MKLKMLHFFKANKHDLSIGITLFSLSFLFYVVFAAIITIIARGYDSLNAFFDADTFRVYADMTVANYTHYRTIVHPLFVILTQPFVLIVNFFTRNTVAACVLVQTFVSAVNITLLYGCLRKIGLNTKRSLAVSVLFALTVPQFIFSVTLETYIFAQLGLLIMWLCALFFVKKKTLNLNDYTVLALLGIASLSITVTNFVQYIIVLLIVIALNRKETKKLTKISILVVSALCITTTIAQIQSVVWPSSVDFFKGNISAIVKKDSEELLYIEKQSSIMSRVTKQIRHNTTANIPLFITKNGDERETEFRAYSIKGNVVTNIVAYTMFIAIAVIHGRFIRKHRKTLLTTNKIYSGMIAAYIVNFAFHMCYGNLSGFLYTPHYNFLLILATAYVWRNSNGLSRLTKNQRILSGLFFLVIVSQTIGLIWLTKEIVSAYGVHCTVPKTLAICVACVGVMCAILLWTLRSRKKYIIFVLLSVVAMLIGVKLFNSYFTNRQNAITQSKQLLLKDSQVRKGVEDLDAYYNELDNKLLSEKFKVQKYGRTNRKKADFFYFGMVDRRKMVYRRGKLYDLFTKEVIKKWSVKAEFIIPSEYTVALLDENNKLVKIFENEDGVFVKEDDAEAILTKGSEKFKLPRFEGKKYARILRVLHQELLFNIHNGIPKPNILTYKDGGGWYRDGMVMTMALEHTNNQHVLEKWVASLKDIYDHHAGDEADNPGELLYILGAVKNNRQDLVDKIFAEVKSKARDGHFSGPCDGTWQTYYPTALLLNGARKIGQNLPVELSLPNIDDGYGVLTWWYPDRRIINDGLKQKHSDKNVEKWPYLTWAEAHYRGNDSSVYILDEVYPLSYEGSITGARHVTSQNFFNSFYTQDQGLSLSHTWHAAEMFLLLNEL